MLAHFWQHFWSLARLHPLGIAGTTARKTGFNIYDRVFCRCSCLPPKQKSTLRGVPQQTCEGPTGMGSRLTGPSDNLAHSPTPCLGPSPTERMDYLDGMYVGLWSPGEGY